MQFVEKIVFWSWSLEEIVALNVDGSVFFNVAIVGFGGLIHDHHSDFFVVIMALVVACVLLTKFFGSFL
jgi:Ca2+/Na+ antiporter